MVLIASDKPHRYSNLALNKLMDHQVPVVAIGRRESEVRGLTFLTGQPHFDDIHTLTLYLNPVNQLPFYDYILNIKPKRVIFNPGTENRELQGMLDEHSISWEESCTLVLLSTDQF